MGFIEKKINGLKRRLQCLSYGIVYLRSSDFTIPDSFLVNGRIKKLKFLKRSTPAFIYEFSEICINDCYKLKLIKSHLPHINVVVDIGANQGIFALAARHTFADALIHCYEPNSSLAEVLMFNTSSLNATAYFEAVTIEDTKVLLNFGETDLHTTTVQSNEGNVTGTAFRSVIQRADGEIDILKMDCEGAEWDLLDESSLWNKIKSITMEYHLWARPGMTTEWLLQRISDLGFVVISHERLSESFGLVAAVRK